MMVDGLFWRLSELDRLVGWIDVSDVGVLLSNKITWIWGSNVEPGSLVNFLSPFDGMFADGSKYKADGGSVIFIIWICISHKKKRGIDKIQCCLFGLDEHFGWFRYMDLVVSWWRIWLQISDSLDSAAFLQVAASVLDEVFTVGSGSYSFINRASLSKWIYISQINQLKIVWNWKRGQVEAWISYVNKTNEMIHGQTR